METEEVAEPAEPANPGEHSEPLRRFWLQLSQPPLELWLEILLFKRSDDFDILTVLGYGMHPIVKAIGSRVKLRIRRLDSGEQDRSREAYVPYNITMSSPKSEVINFLKAVLLVVWRLDWVGEREELHCAGRGFPLPTGPIFEFGAMCKEAERMLLRDGVDPEVLELALVYEHAVNEFLDRAPDPELLELLFVGIE
jgi:hypothetical protein